MNKLFPDGRLDIERLIVASFCLTGWAFATIAETILKIMQHHENNKKEQPAANDAPDPGIMQPLSLINVLNEIPQRMLVKIALGRGLFIAGETTAKIKEMIADDVVTAKNDYSKELPSAAERNSCEGFK